jgi:hypothetical protein
MLNRNALMLVAGAAIFALDASAASAQDTTRTRPRSTTRIPVTKEAPGEVVAPRVDSVMVYRTDTLRLPGRTDTVVTTNTITRVDTVSIPLPPILQIGGFYFGVGGGSSLPAANFNDSDHPGWRVEGMLGVDPLGSPFGVRLTGAYNRYEPHSYVQNVLGNAQIMSLALDGKLRLVKVQPFSKRVQLYGIAGGTYNRFKDVLENNKGILSVGDNIGGNQVLPSVIDHDWHNGWGYNVGGGAELGWGRTNLFIESRFARFSGENSKISSVPVVIGLSWF